MNSVLAPIENAAKDIKRFHTELGAENRHLLGYVMELGYDTGIVVTNDYYKMRAGGISKNSLLVIRPGSITQLMQPDETTSSIDIQDKPPHLILCRVLEPAPTPLAQDIARTYFEMHKSHMPELDVFTKSELQWGAVKVAVLGTFYDHPVNATVEFGGDIETFLSPHMYTVHIPTADMLTKLVNAFVDPKNAYPIGEMRLTESRLTAPSAPIPVQVSPADFIGTRTALFGKTRMGKSNTIKIIAQMILESSASVGQVIFDLSGEYANLNGNDKTSLFDLYKERCVRYSLRESTFSDVRPLKVDFFADIALGHQIITQSYRNELGTEPDYLKGLFEWEVMDDAELQRLEQDERSRHTHYRRQESIYKCILTEAGFVPGAANNVSLNMKAEIRTACGAATAESVTVDRAAEIFKQAWTHFVNKTGPFKSKQQPSGQESNVDEAPEKEYFDSTEQSMLATLTGLKWNKTTVSGFRKIQSYRRYHQSGAGRLLDDITRFVDQGKTVIIDLGNASEELSSFFGDRVCRHLFQHQTTKFVNDKLEEHYVQFYFEEAHNLFPRDDKDLRKIYNRLAKEGAKFHIGMIYATQSIESLSPDLLKNSENFFVAHLNDDREITALTRYHEFRDVGPDVQRTKSQGYVRMITRSHRFALPVQIRKFAAKG
ncbi:ATP-binding protein [candidate division KSB1 bacterium]|nr:ATP-binding protein [candidate division KSB1 bacterium]